MLGWRKVPMEYHLEHRYLSTVQSRTPSSLTGGLAPVLGTVSAQQIQIGFQPWAEIRWKNPTSPQGDVWPLVLESGKVGLDPGQVTGVRLPEKQWTASHSKEEF